MPATGLRSRRPHSTAVFRTARMVAKVCSIMQWLEAARARSLIHTSVR
jgi:hypothetical protein